MAFKIYTKTGDLGETGLYGGKRLPKNHVRISAYGMVDELNAHIGHLRDLIINTNQRTELLQIQHTLFNVGAHLAATNKMIAKLPKVGEVDITFLENSIDEMEKTLAPMVAFILPGGHPTVSFAHIVRTVCRRAERETVALHHVEAIEPIHFQYLNRLSDYIFVLSRKIAAELKVAEVNWLPKKES